jgi:hypothetical protein
MNPLSMTVAVLAQIAILQWISPSHTGLALSLGLTSLFTILACSRRIWDPHLDMILIMLSYGGLGMLLPTLVTGEVCPHHFHATHFIAMSVLMWVFSLPVVWTQARCVQAYKQFGRGHIALLADAAGMQAGMFLAHVPISLLPMGTSSGPWITQAVMLIGMTLGMLAVQSFVMPRLLWNE